MGGRTDARRRRVGGRGAGAYVARGVSCGFAGVLGGQSRQAARPFARLRAEGVRSVRLSCGARGATSAACGAGVAPVGGQSRGAGRPLVSKLLAFIRSGVSDVHRVPDRAPLARSCAHPYQRRAAALRHARAMLKRRTDRDRELALAEAGIPVWSPGPRGPARIYKNRHHQGSKKAPKCVACFPGSRAGQRIPLPYGVTPRALQPAPRPALRRLALRPRLPGRHRRALQRPRHHRPPLRRRAPALRAAVHQPRQPKGGTGPAPTRTPSAARTPRPVGPRRHLRTGLAVALANPPPGLYGVRLPTSAPSAAGGTNDAGSSRPSSDGHSAPLAA